ncbi:MAG: UDP-N-acetylmuramoyl-L-alanyl-D-glutamate--2,6-diaminopimelate ligase [Candidatus Aminicenantes bacterium]|nr:UDP-N-acetylmuramoyl-L-alanyl-D-glutamate--2,6-diaminopimelate ligase [Candidatus Aminicenantes bacterium]
MKLIQLLKAIRPINLIGPEDLEITGLTCHSKKVEPGFLFAALKGQKYHGLNFIDEAINRGALAILSETSPPANWPLTWIEVRDARQALALLAAEFYGHPSSSMKVIGITGTKGKTTITYLLESIILKAAGKPAVIGTINYRGPGLFEEAGRTTPEAPDLQKMLRIFLDHGATHAILEVSSHSLSLNRVLGVNFDLAIFTNLSPEHLDFHSTMEDYFEAKKKLFFLNKKKRTAIVNQDDPWGKRLISELPMTTITFGFEPEALIRASHFELTEKKTKIIISYPGAEVEIETSLLGQHNIYNVLAAFAAALALNIDIRAISEGIKAVQFIPGRLEKIENDLGLSIFVDYAHTESALERVLETLRGFKPKRLIVVFGCGGDRDPGKREKMGEVAGRWADLIFVTSDNPRNEDPMAIIYEIERGIKRTGFKKYFLEPDRRQAIKQALEIARRGDIVVVAGKGHEGYQEIAGQRFPFNDGQVIREILKELAKEPKNGT